MYQCKEQRKFTLRNAQRIGLLTLALTCSSSSKNIDIVSLTTMYRIIPTFGGYYKIT